MGTQLDSARRPEGDRDAQPTPIALRSSGANIRLLRRQAIGSRDGTGVARSDLL